MWQGLHSGKVLITLATGVIPGVEAERAGLVPTHAYALLDMREVGYIGLRAHTSVYFIYSLKLLHSG